MKTAFWLMFTAFARRLSYLFRLKRLKLNFLLVFIGIIGAIALSTPLPIPATEVRLTTTIPRSERAVLFYFDGLHPEAIERFDLPNLKRLQAEGTTVEKAVMTGDTSP
ncbi:MAG: hypothetical protein AB4368_30465 [Xenococcaceae cyanobacterium]